MLSSKGYLQVDQKQFGVGKYNIYVLGKIVDGKEQSFAKIKFVDDALFNNADTTVEALIEAIMV